MDSIKLDNDHKPLLYRGHGGPDRITLYLDKALFDEVYGRYKEYWQGGGLSIEVPRGTGEKALTAFGFTEWSTVDLTNLVMA